MGRPTFSLRTAWTLFSSTFIVSAFTFGGGYVIIPLLKRRFCDELGWIEEDEIMDLAAIAQTSPGAVAVNAAIIIGCRIGGPAGALISTVGTVLPPLLIITAIEAAYEAFSTNHWVRAALSGMQAGVAAVIADVSFNLARRIGQTRNIILLAIMITVFVLSFVFNVSVVYIILACIVIGVIMSALPPGFGTLRKKEQEEE